MRFINIYIKRRCGTGMITNSQLSTKDQMTQKFTAIGYRTDFNTG